MARLQNWLATYWVIGAGFMAAALLAATPALALPLLPVLIFLHSPAYMIHQTEEHTGDRFRRFANSRVFAGRDALTTNAVLVINLPLVWGVNLLALYAALLWGPAWGLVAPYLVVVNALAHLATSVRLRRYNPGLVTAIILFLPLGLATIWLTGLTGHLVPQLLSAAVAILIHAAIVIAVLARYRGLAVPPAAPAPA